MAGIRVVLGTALVRLANIILPDPEDDIDTLSWELEDSYPHLK